MAFKDLLKKELEKKLSKKELDLLPSGFQKIGDIIIVNLNSELKNFKKEIGEAVLKIFPKIKTVCSKEGEITGKFREPQIKIIAGEKDTKTCHLENGCFYCFDVRKVMFAKGNVSERVRLVKQIKKGEVIVDMFAGIGYFTIPLAKLAEPKKIYSIELNPVSFEFLTENIKKNKIENKVEAINSDCKKEILKLVETQGRIADRVILGYLPPPKEFLPYAMKVVKKGGVIHYEDLVGVDKKEEDINRVMGDVKAAAEKEDLKVKLLLAKKIKGYGPKIDHYVFDIKIL